MTKILVVHSRKGGVGKTTLAYDLAFILGAVLLDLDWEEGGATRVWGYRWEDRVRSPLLTALETRRAPKPLRGFRKPLLVPGHPEFEQVQPSADNMADLLTDWAGEWGTDWVVIDTHPGATSATNGALSIADIVIAPTVLATKDLNATEGLVRELADYPLVLVPNKVPPIPPAAEVNRLEAMIAGTPVQVGPLVPQTPAVAVRKKRMAITSEDPTPKALRRVAAALTQVAEFAKEYTNA